MTQTSDAYEYIVVDGASRDNTVTKVCSLVDNLKFPIDRFTIVSESDKGVYDAMNKGVQLAKGEYVLFMNGGDSFYDENVINNFVDSLSRLPVDAIYGNTMIEFYEGKGVFHDDEDNNRNSIMPFIHQSVIVRRSLLMKHPFDLSYRICADNEFFYWMRQSGCTFLHENFIVSNYDAREGLSENNPFLIEIEKDRITGRNKQSHYWLRKIILRCTKGIIQPIKDFAPRSLLNWYFRRKKTYIDWKE